MINDTYILVNNQLYYGQNNLWNIILNGIYLITSIIPAVNNVYLYINNGKSLIFNYIVANNYNVLPETINIGEYVIYNNNIYVGTDRYWNLLTSGTYIITSDNLLYNNKFTNINITNSLVLFNNIQANIVNEKPIVSQDTFIIYNNNLYHGNNNLWELIYNDYYYINNLDKTFIINNNAEMIYFIPINNNYKINNNNLYFNFNNNLQLITYGYYEYNDILYYIDMSEGSLIDINFNNINANIYDIFPNYNETYIINNNILYTATTKLIGTYKYKISFYNTETLIESYPSNEIAITNNDTNKYIELSDFSPIYDDKYNSWKIYRTTNEGNSFYLINIVKNNVYTNYIDNNPNSIIIKTPYILPFFYLSRPVNTNLINKPTQNIILSSLNKGKLLTHNYKYVITYYDDINNVESYPSNIYDINILNDNSQISISLPISSDNNISSRIIYREINNKFRFLTKIHNNTDTIYIDNINNDSLGYALMSNIKYPLNPINYILLSVSNNNDKVSYFYTFYNNITDTSSYPSKILETYNNIIKLLITSIIDKSITHIRIYKNNILIHEIENDIYIEYIDNNFDNTLNFSIMNKSINNDVVINKISNNNSNIKNGKYSYLIISNGYSTTMNYDFSIINENIKFTFTNNNYGIIIYRTINYGLSYKLLTTLNKNVLTFIDDINDNQLLSDYIYKSYIKLESIDNGSLLSGTYKYILTFINKDTNNEVLCANNIIKLLSNNNVKVHIPYIPDNRISSLKLYRTLTNQSTFLFVKSFSNIINGNIFIDNLDNNQLSYNINIYNNVPSLTQDIGYEIIDNGDNILYVGNVLPGVYKYMITFYGDNYESIAINITTINIVSLCKIKLFLPISNDIRVKGRNIYKSKDNTFYLLSSKNNNTDLFYIDNNDELSYPIKTNNNILNSLNKITLNEIDNGDLVNGNYKYVFTYYNELTNEESFTSSLSDINISNNKNILLTIPKSDNINVSHKLVYRTMVNTNYYKFLVKISNNTNIFIDNNNNLDYDIITLYNIKPSKILSLNAIDGNLFQGTYKYKIVAYNYNDMSASSIYESITIDNNQSIIIRISNNNSKLYRSYNNSDYYYITDMIDYIYVDNNIVLSEEKLINKKILYGNFIDENINNNIINTNLLSMYSYYNKIEYSSYNLLKMPINDIVPNLNDYISHSSDCDFINTKNLSDLNDYIFNKSFIMLSSNKSSNTKYTNINSLKLALNSSLLYFYNIPFKLNETSKITLNNFDITFLLPLSTQQFFIKKSDEIYYYPDTNNNRISIINNERITQSTFNPSFDEFNVSSSFLINNYANNYVNLLSDKITHFIDNNNEYKVLIDTIENINNTYLQLFDNILNNDSLSKYCGSSTLKVFNSINFKFSNLDFNQYSHYSLRLLKDNNNLQDKLTIYNLINLLTPVYDYYNANKKITSDIYNYLINVSLYFKNHINYINNNEIYLELSNPNNYYESYLSNDEINLDVINNFYDKNNIYNIELLHPILNNNIYKLTFNDININNFTLNNNIISTSLFNKEICNNKYYDKSKIINENNNKFKYLGLVSCNINNKYISSSLTQIFKFDDNNIYSIVSNNIINDNIEYKIINKPYRIILPDNYNVLELIKIPLSYVYKIKLNFNNYIVISISNLSLNDIPVNNIYIINNQKLYIGTLNSWVIVNNGFYNINNNLYKIINGNMYDITLSSFTGLFSIDNNLIEGTLIYDVLYLILPFKINLISDTIYYFNNNKWNMISNISNYDIKICQLVNYKIDSIINNNYYEINNNIIYYDSFSIINYVSYIFISSDENSILIKEYTNVSEILYSPMEIKYNIIYNYINNINYSDDNYVLLTDESHIYFILLSEINLVLPSNYNCWIYLNDNLPLIYYDIDITIDNNSNVNFNSYLPNYSFYMIKYDNKQFIYYYEKENIMNNHLSNNIFNITIRGIYLIDNDIFDSQLKQMMKVYYTDNFYENYISKTINYNKNIFTDTIVSYDSYYTLESFEVYNKIINNNNEDIIVKLLFNVNDINIYYPLILTNNDNHVIDNNSFIPIYITSNSLFDTSYKISKIVTNDTLISTSNDLILINVVDTNSRYYDVYIKQNFSVNLVNWGTSSQVVHDLLLWKIKCIDSNDNIYFMYIWTLFSNNNELINYYKNISNNNISQPLYITSNFNIFNYKLISSSPNILITDNNNNIVLNNDNKLNSLYYKYYLDTRDNNNYQYDVKIHNYNGIFNIKPKLIFSQTPIKDFYICISNNNIYFNNEFNLINNSGYYLLDNPIRVYNPITIIDNKITKYDKTYLEMEEIIIINDNFYYVNGLNVSTQHYELTLLRGNYNNKTHYNGYYTLGKINIKESSIPSLSLNTILSYNQDVSVSMGTLYYDPYIDKIIISKMKLELSNINKFNNNSIELKLFYHDNKLFYFDNFIKLSKFDIIIHNNSFYEIINIRDNEIITNPKYSNITNNIYINFTLPYQPFENIFITDTTIIDDNNILLLDYNINFKSITIFNYDYVVNGAYIIQSNKLYIGNNNTWELIINGYYKNENEYFFVSNSVIIKFFNIIANNDDNFINNTYVIYEDKLYYNNQISMGYYYIKSNNIIYNNNLIHVNSLGKINIITNNLYYNIHIVNNNNISQYINKWVRILKSNYNSYFENKYTVPLNQYIDFYDFPFEILTKYENNRFKILNKLNNPNFYIMQPVKLCGSYNYIKHIVKENNDMFIYLLNDISVSNNDILITFSPYRYITYYFPLECNYNNSICIKNSNSNSNTIKVIRFLLKNDKLIFYTNKNGYNSDIIFEYGKTIKYNESINNINDGYDSLYFYNYRLVNDNGYIDNYNIIYNSYHLLKDKFNMIYLVKILYGNKIKYYSNISIINDKYYLDNVFSIYISNNSYVLSLSEIYEYKSIYYPIYDSINIIYKYDIKMVNDLIFEDNIYKQEIMFSHDVVDINIYDKVYINNVYYNIIKSNDKYYITNNTFISNSYNTLYTISKNYIKSAQTNIINIKNNISENMIYNKYNYITYPLLLYRITGNDYYYNFVDNNNKIILDNNNYYINDINLSVNDINNKIITLDFDVNFISSTVNLIQKQDITENMYNDDYLPNVKELKAKLYYVHIDIRYIFNYLKPWDEWTLFNINNKDLLYNIHLKYDNGNVIKINNNNNYGYLTNNDITKLTYFLIEMNNNIRKNNYYNMINISTLIFNEVKVWLKHPNFFVNCIENINNFLKYNLYDAYFDGNNIIFNNDLKPNYYNSEQLETSSQVFDWSTKSLNEPSYYITNEYVYNDNIVYRPLNSIDIINNSINKWINKTKSDNMFYGVSVNKLLRYLIFLGNNYNDILNKNPISTYDVNNGLKVAINELWNKYKINGLNPDALNNLTLNNSDNIFPYKVSLYQNNIITNSKYYISFIDREDLLITNPIIYPNIISFYSPINLDNIDYMAIIQNTTYDIIVNEYIGHIYNLVINNVNYNYVDKIYYNNNELVILNKPNMTLAIKSKNIINTEIFELFKYMSIKTTSIINNKLYLKFYNMNFNYINNNTYINIDNNIIKLYYDDNGYYVDKIIINIKDVIIINKVIPTVNYTFRVIYNHELNRDINYNSNGFNEFIVDKFNPININILSSKKLTGIYDDNLDNYNFTKLYHNIKLNHIYTNKILNITFLNEYIYEIKDNIHLTKLSDIFIYNDNDIDILNHIYEPIDINKKSLYIFNNTSFVLNKYYNLKNMNYIIKNRWNINSYYYTDTNIIITIPNDMVIIKNNYYYKINDYVIDKKLFIINQDKLIINWEYPQISGNIFFYQYYIEPSNQITNVIIPKFNKKYNIKFKNPYQFSHNLFYIIPYTINGNEFKKYLYKIKTSFTTNLNGYQPTTINNLYLYHNNIIFNGTIFLTYHDTYIYYITSFNELIDINNNYRYQLSDNIFHNVIEITYYQQSIQFGTIYNQTSLDNINIFMKDVNNYDIIDNEYNNYYLVSYDKYDIENLYSPIIIKQSDNMKIKVNKTITNINKVSLPEFINYNKFFKYIKLYFNNQLIDEINEDIFNIHYHLYLSPEKKLQYDNITKINKTQYGWTFYIPLIFWYSLNPGLALPTVAMNNTEIKLEYKLNEFKYIVNNNIDNNIITPNIKVSLISDCILLDIEERKLFGNLPHEYVISRYQPITYNYLNDKKIVISKKISGLIKDIVFITKPISNSNITYIPEYIKDYDSRYDRYITSYEYYVLYINNGNIYTSEEQKKYILDIEIINNNNIEYNKSKKSDRINRLSNMFGKMDIWNDDLLKYLMYYEDKFLGYELSDSRKNYIIMIYLKYQYKCNIITNELSPINSIMITVNGEKLFNAMDDKYFNCIIPTQKYNNSLPSGYYCYTFSLYPLESQYSGHLNFTNFDDVSITITSDNILPCNIYTVIKEYNIIRIMSDLAELAWIN